jgi:hypothetical protein
LCQPRAAGAVTSFRFGLSKRLDFDYYAGIRLS